MKTPAHIVIGIPCLLTGGTERQTLLMAKALMQDQAECAAPYAVTILCYFEYEEKMVAEFRVAGCTVRLLNWRRPLSPWSFVLRLRKCFREDPRPDLVHIQYMEPGFLSILAARLAGFHRVMTTIHYPCHGHGWKARVLIRTAGIFSRRICCVSKAVAVSWFGESFARNGVVTVLPNAIDLHALDLVQAIPSACRPVVCIARLSREKGVDLLLHAFAAVRLRKPGAVLVIVGDGPERERLQALAVTLGVSCAIQWMGTTSWESCIAFMKQSALVVVPSRFEGFGLTALEAMGCGRAVAAFGVGGLAGLVLEGETGRLAEAGNAEALARAMLDLLQDNGVADRMGIRGRELAEEHYSFTAYAPRCRELHKEWLCGF